VLRVNRALPTLLSLLLAASCARELELVDPPTPPAAPAGLPAPALLGALSGDWLLEA